MDAVCPESNHAELLTTPQHTGEFCEIVVRAKKHPQLLKALEVCGQFGEAVARQVENFKGIGKIENLPWKLGEARWQIKTRCPLKLASLELDKRCMRVAWRRCHRLTGPDSV